MGILRRATPTDLAALLALHEEAFDDERRPAADAVKAGLPQAWVLPGPGRLDGAFFLKPGAEAYLWDLAIHPGTRGQGVGGKLLAHAEAESRRANAASLLVEAEEQDPRLVAWYVGHGFSPAGRTQDFFHAGCSAIRLRKVL